MHGVEKKVVVCLVWLSFLGGGALLLCFVAGTMVIHVCPFFSRLFYLLPIMVELPWSNSCWLRCIFERWACLVAAGAAVG